MSILPAVPAQVDAAIEALLPRLEGVRLFGREVQIEEVLTRFDFPDLHPHSVILTGPAAAGCSRMLANFPELFAGQPLPVAEVHCNPDRQSIPFDLVIALLTRFLTAYSPARLEQLVGPALHSNRWLAWTFPHLRRGIALPPPPPEDLRQLQHGFTALLTGLLRVLPHLAVVHNLEAADLHSLALLAGVQQMPQQGLRILTATMSRAGTLPAALQPFLATQGHVVALPALPRERMAEYLEEIAPELITEAFADALYIASAGQPLGMETVLRSWVCQGSLTLTDEGWSYTPPDEETLSETTDPFLLKRLGQAALVGPTNGAFLTLLWHTTTAETGATIAEGRRLGYLASADAENPDAVACTDLDYTTYLVQHLTPEQQAATHHEIALLLEEMHVRQQAREETHHLIYHLQQAGLDEKAHHYLQAAQQAMRECPPTPPPPPEGLVPVQWDIAPPLAVDDVDLPLLVQAALAIRLAGVQYRLYPLHGRPVEECLQQAMAAINTLFLHRPSLTITWDGATVAFDGHEAKQRDLTIAARDYRLWMESGYLHAIGFARGLHKDELGRFLHTLATHEPKEGILTLLSKITACSVKHIKVLSRCFAVESAQTRSPDETPAFSHTSILAYLATGGEPIPAEERPPEADTDVAFVQADEAYAASPADQFTVSKNWAQFPAMLEQSSPQVRGLLMNNLLHWLLDEGHHEEALPENLDSVVCARLEVEDDVDALTPTLSVADHRLNRLLSHRDWTDIVSYLETACVRFATDTDPLVHQHFGDFLTQVGGGEAFSHLIDDLSESPTHLAHIQYLVNLLGEYAIHPLLERLKQSGDIQERLFFVHLIAQLCADQQAVLLQELRAEHPWYLHRNLLQILGRIGTADALGAIGEKIGHPDARVRAEAIATAAAIARDQAHPYLLRGLADKDPFVRTRAATMACLCPQTPVLEALLRLLRPSAWGREEPEHVQIAACLALGQFPHREARQTLLGLARAGFRKRSDALRGAAVAALAGHLHDPAVQAALQQARQDQSPQVRQAAERAWDACRQHQTRTP